MGRSLKHNHPERLAIGRNQQHMAFPEQLSNLSW